MCPFLLKPQRYYQHKPASALAPARPGILYTCGDSSVSVFPLGGTTIDTARRATSAANEADAAAAATTHIMVTCIQPRTRITTRGQENAHKCQSNPST